MARILVADDDPRTVRLLTMTLPEDYEILQALNGEDAVRTAEEEHPDLILLDVNMPGLNGFEVLQRVRQSKSLANTHVIMITARKDDADQQLGLALGATFYITKPFSPLELLSKVTDLVDKQ